MKRERLKAGLEKYRMFLVLCVMMGDTTNVRLKRLILILPYKWMFLLDIYSKEIFEKVNKDACPCWFMTSCLYPLK